MQKHHKSVFSVLLFFIIVAFVFTIGSSIPFFGDRNVSFDDSKNKKDFYGWDLSDENIVNFLYTGAYYDVLLAGGNPRNQDTVMNALYTRAMLLTLAKSANLPTVSDKEYKEYIHSRPFFADKNGKFSYEKFSKFIAESRMPTEYLNSTLLESALVNKLMNIISGPGYIQQADIDANYKLINSKWTFDIASLSLDSFKAETKVNDEALKKFYDANKARYEVLPEYALQVAFFAIDPTEKVDLSESELTKFYDANKSKFVEEKDGKQQLKPFVSVREEVAKSVKEAALVRSAMIKAQDFSDKVYDASTTFNSDAFKSLLKASNVSLKKVKPFHQNDSDFDKSVPVSVLRAGLALDEKTWIAPDVVADEKGAYVVFLESKKAAYIPEFAAVKEQVKNDYVESERYRMFNEKAQELSKELTKAVAEKQSFEKVAKKLAMAVKSVKQFSLAEPKQEDLSALGSAFYAVMQTLPQLKANEVSKPVVQAQNAYVFYVSNIEYSPINKDSKEYKNYAKSAQQQAAFRSLGSFISTMENSALKSAPKDGE